MESGLVTTLYVSSSNRLVDMLIKDLPTVQFQAITCKLRVENINYPALGGVLEGPIFSYRLSSQYSLREYLRF